MENFILPYMSVYGIYMCRTFISLRGNGIFHVLDLKNRKWSSWKTRHRYARFVNDEENGCRFEGQRKETWICTLPAWLSERLLDFFVLN